MHITQKQFDEITEWLNTTHEQTCDGGLTANGIHYARNPKNGRLEPLIVVIDEEENE